MQETVLTEAALRLGAIAIGVFGGIEKHTRSKAETPSAAARPAELRSIYARRCTAVTATVEPGLRILAYGQQARTALVLTAEFQAWLWKVLPAAASPCWQRWSACEGQKAAVRRRRNPLNDRRKRTGPENRGQPLI